MTRARLASARRPLLALEVLLAYVRVRRLLRRTDVGDALHRLREAGPGSARVTREDALPVASRLGRAVAGTLRLLPTDTRCLTQSLVLVHLLARRGIDASVVIGVTTTPEFAAHAWVESDSVALLPTLAPTFEPLAEL